MIVFVSSALAFAVLVAQYTGFNVLPFPIQEAKAIKLKTPPSPPNQRSLFERWQYKYANFVFSSSIQHCLSWLHQLQSFHEQLLSAVVVQLDLLISITNSMIVVSSVSNLQMVYWFLNANLVITKGATFHIDSTDTKWLKVDSKVASASIAKTTFPAYIIDVHGS